MLKKYVLVIAFLAGQILWASTLKMVDDSNDIDVSKIVFQENGSSCQIYMDDVTDTVVWTDCKETISEQVGSALCLPNNNTCITETDIVAFLHSPKSYDKSIDAIKHIKIGKEIESVSFYLEGNGEKCVVNVYNEDMWHHTTCLELQNSKKVKILCTGNKRVCKTLSEIHKDITGLYLSEHVKTDQIKKNIKKFRMALFDFGTKCYDNLWALNNEFESNRKVSNRKSQKKKFNKLSAKLDSTVKKCQLVPNFYKDIYYAEGMCLYGADNLKSNIAKYQASSNPKIETAQCAQVSLASSFQVKIVSYDQQNKMVRLILGLGLQAITGVKDFYIYNNKLSKKLASCNKSLVRAKCTLVEGIGCYDLDCEHVDKIIDSIALEKKCKSNNAQSCYSYAEYLSQEKTTIGNSDPMIPAKKSFLLKRSKFGPDDIMMAKNYAQLGRLYIEKNDYSKAMKLFKKALDLDVKYLGEKHLDTANVYENIGDLYLSTGDFPRVLQYLEKALSIKESISQAKNGSIADNYYLMGNTYKAIGNYEKALDYLQKSLEIREKLLGKFSLDTTLTYNATGEVFLAMHKYEKALKNFNKALDIRLKMLYEEHPDTVKIYTNLAFTYKELGNYVKSEKFYNRALYLQGDKKTPISAYIQNGIGELSFLTKKYSKALSYFQRAMATQESILGQNHPETSLTYYNMAYTYYKMRNYKKAYMFAKKSFDSFLENRDKNFQIQTNEQKEQYLKENAKKIQLLMESAISYVKSNPSKKKQVIKEVFNSWLNYKGSIFDSENAIASLYVSTKDKILKEKIDKLITNKRYLATLYQSLPKPKERENWQRNIKDTEEKIHTLASEISYQASNFKEQQGLKTINYEDIAKNLKDNELYIDYAKIGKYYYMFALDKTKKIILKQISEKDSQSVDTSVQSFRKDIESILNDTSMSDATLNALAKSSRQKLSKLYEIVLSKPLAKVLKSKKSLIISPDGALRLLPFEALFDKKKGKYLIEEKEIRYIPSGKELVRLYKYSKAKKTNNNTVIFANPDFNAKIGKLALSQKEEVAVTPNTSRAGIIKSLFTMRFNPLPGTKAEAISIKETLAGSTKLQEYVQAEASEANLMQVKEPNILHIATHGFFINDNTIPNPMLKSGIALSGANTSAIKGTSDGIVTSLKLSGLNLKGTDLVVLSACETGVVDVNSTESVSGLSKAFIQAGAKDTVISLWSVDDQATKELMSSFYKEMQVQPDYAKAMQEAKLKMIKKDMHPFYWAPFIVNGL